MLLGDKVKKKKKKQCGVKITVNYSLQSFTHSMLYNILMSESVIKRTKK
jgi:hypothetical protein